MNKTHVKELLKGSDSWDKYAASMRRKNPWWCADLTRANLSNANLSRANLSNADLSCADLSRANLSNADLSRANLSNADLSCADLSRANLSNADLSRANLSNADLSDANLSNANLSNANLSYANLSDAVIDALTLARLSIVPENGAFEAWKMCRDNVLVRVRIPADARRSNATGRKCRADFVEVLDVIGADVGISTYDADVIYKTGEIVHCHTWAENRWKECSGGIHFFLSRIEAENYQY